MWKQIMRVIIASAALIAVCQTALADLTSPTYVKAKNFYEKGDCDDAVPLLKQWLLQDTAFLKQHGDIKSAVANAIQFCNPASAKEAEIKMEGGVKVKGDCPKKTNYWDWENGQCRKRRPSRPPLP